MERTSSLESTPILSQSFAVGQGFNIYGTLDISGLLRPLFDFSKAPKETFTFLGKDYLVPQPIIAVENTQGYVHEGTYESRENLQNSLAVNAGVEASYGAFSGEIRSDYSGEFTQNSQYVYSYKTSYNQLAFLELNDTSDYLNDDFKHAVAQLPDEVTPNNTQIFFQFFTKYGVYYTQKIVLGGSLKFLSSIEKKEELSQQKLDFLFNAQYEGLFSSGKIDSKVSVSQDWQTFSQNSRQSVIAQGGTAEAVAAFQQMNLANPSNDTVSAYKQWAASLQTDPAIVDFQLAGIWQLCGDKEQAVLDAWQAFGQVMHPRLTIYTASNIISWPYVDSPVTPTITLGEQLVPNEPAATACGYQVIVLDSAKLSDTSAVLFNRYYTLPKVQSWGQVYPNMYNEMLTDLKNNNLVKNGNVLVLASFGMDNDMPPTNAMFGFLESAGAGETVADWINNCDPGSQVGNNYSWVSFPVVYVLVGMFNSGPGTGVEFFGNAHGDSQINANLEVFFYRESYNGKYTIGLG
ncbi:MAC/perforin domain-containing protein [Alicyclobacillus fodiniaquatilis]|uniref:MAC/perforin domain-containing protein n=1 Tax=Alicyclobacillus fodiniaquatilis TaxID=1661150 RepID=A0ABW4JDL9_9BACL